jgi:hypothetical protein
MITYNREELILREVQFMAASGWTLYQRRRDGADFVQPGTGSGISTGVHVILLVLTFGLWLPIMLVVELASSGGARYCRLTFDPWGDPRYDTIKKPRR